MASSDFRVSRVWQESVFHISVAERKCQLQARENVLANVSAKWVRNNATRPHRLIDYPAWFADTAKCVQPASRVPSIAFRYIPRPSSES